MQAIEIPFLDPTFKASLMPRVTKVASGCWLWSSAKNNGYGFIKINRRQYYAHRIFYTLFKGAIPNALPLDHLCRTRNCVNPKHLEAVTPQENVLRGETMAAYHAAKTHCPKGHLYDRQGRRSGRYCFQCKKATKQGKL